MSLPNLDLNLVRALETLLAEFDPASATGTLRLALNDESAANLLDLAVVPDLRGVTSRIAVPTTPSTSAIGSTTAGCQAPTGNGH